MNFEEFWNGINPLTSVEFRKNFSGIAIRLLQVLLEETLKWENIDIGIGLHDEKAYSMITYDQWNSDKQLSLRLHHGGKFDLYFESHEADDYMSVVYELTQLDLLIIPDGLKELMEKALQTRQSIGVQKNSISRASQ